MNGVASRSDSLAEAGPSNYRHRLNETSPRLVDESLTPVIRPVHPSPERFSEPDHEVVCIFSLSSHL